MTVRKSLQRLVSGFCVLFHVVHWRNRFYKDLDDCRIKRKFKLNPLTQNDHSCALDSNTHNSPSGKLLCLWQTAKKYAAHAWQHLTLILTFGPIRLFISVVYREDRLSRVTVHNTSLSRRIRHSLTGLDSVALYTTIYRFSCLLIQSNWTPLALRYLSIQCKWG